MSRKRRADRRQIIPDPKFRSTLVTQFMNALFRKGKKSTSERTFYSALDLVTEKAEKDGLEVFQQALDNVRPAVQVKSRRVGGATYQVPVEVRGREAQSLSMRWIIQFSRERGEKTMAERLAGEFMDAANRQGRSMQRREETHRMAEANRAFAHYRW